MPALHIDPPEAGTLVRGRITYLPVVPGRIEFAWRVRRHIALKKPQVVAVELPTSLEQLYERAADRLPQMSVLVIPEREDSERGTYIPVEPGDPFVEAIRSAKE